MHKYTSNTLETKKLYKITFNMQKNELYEAHKGEPYLNKR